MQLRGESERSELRRRGKRMRGELSGRMGPLKRAVQMRVGREGVSAGGKLRCALGQKRSRASVGGGGSAVERVAERAGQRGGRAGSGCRREKRGGRMTANRRDWLRLGFDFGLQELSCQLLLGGVVAHLLPVGALRFLRFGTNSSGSSGAAGDSRRPGLRLLMPSALIPAARAR